MQNSVKRKSSNWENDKQSRCEILIFLNAEYFDSKFMAGVAQCVYIKSTCFILIFCYIKDRKNVRKMEAKTREIVVVLLPAKTVIEISTLLFAEETVKFMILTFRSPGVLYPFLGTVHFNWKEICMPYKLLRKVVKSKVRLIESLTGFF